MSSKKESYTSHMNKLTNTMAAINSPRNIHFASSKLPIASAVSTPPQRQFVDLDAMVGFGGTSFGNEVTARMYSGSYGVPYNYQRYIGFNEGGFVNSANPFESSNTIDNIHPDNFEGTDIFNSNVPSRMPHSQQQSATPQSPFVNDDTIPNLLQYPQNQLAQQQSPFLNDNTIPNQMQYPQQQLLEQRSSLTNDGTMSVVFDPNNLGQKQQQQLQHSQTNIQHQSPFALGNSINGNNNSGQQQQIFMDVGDFQMEMEEQNISFQPLQGGNPFMMNQVSSPIDNSNRSNMGFQPNSEFSERPPENMVQQIANLLLDMDEGAPDIQNQQNEVSDFQSVHQSSFYGHTADTVITPNSNISSSSSTLPEGDTDMVQEAELEFSEDPITTDEIQKDSTMEQQLSSSLSREGSIQPQSSGQEFRGCLQGGDEELELPNEIFDSNGDTFLHKAIHNLDMEQCLEILQVEVLRKAINLKNRSSEVPLLILIKKCLGICNNVIKNLFEIGVKVNVTDLSGNNMFHIAVAEARSEEQCLSILNVCFSYEQYKEEFKTLLNNRNALGLTAAHIATAKCYCKVIQLLHEHGANLDLTEFQNRKTCIVIAAENGKWDMVKELVKLNADVNIATNTDLRAINYAIIASQVEIIELLFEKGTNVYRWKDKAPSEKIKMLVAKLIRRRQRQRRAERDG